MFKIAVKPEEFANLDSLIKAINAVLQLTDNSRLIFTLQLVDQVNGFLIMLDFDNQSTHQLYFSDAQKLLDRIFGDMVMLQKPIDYRLFVVQWLIAHTSFSQSEDMSIETKH